MFRFGVAHIILLGLLKDFWSQWLPSVKAKAKPRPPGPTSQFVLPKAVRKAIANRGASVMLTELFKKPYSDITKCGSLKWRATLSVSTDSGTVPRNSMCMLPAGTVGTG